MHILLTEFTAHVLRCLVTGCSPRKVTMQTPHPPSRHINLVPVSWAFVRRKVLSDVSTGTVDEFTN